MCNLSLYTDLLYVNGRSRVQPVLTQNITLQVRITDASIRYYFRTLTWYHEGNKLTPGGRITLSSGNTTLTVINSTVADSGEYVARFDGLLIHPYSRFCEVAVLDLLRHYPILKPAVFYVGTTGTSSGEHSEKRIVLVLCAKYSEIDGTGMSLKIGFSVSIFLFIQGKVTLEYESVFKKI